MEMLDVKMCDNSLRKVENAGIDPLVARIT